ncbi:MAG: DoxX family protein [bacterium]|nr:DoxX family protein [bacterium]
MQFSHMRERYTHWFNRVDVSVTEWMARHGITLLRISMGVIFFWFGALKLIPGGSPAEALIRQSITFLPMEWFLPFLAVWEMAIGLGFITGKFMRVTILLLFLQMPGTVSPVFLRPDLVFAQFPFVLTLEGQYIVKNLVLISAGLVVGATVRGGGLTHTPNVRDSQ